MRTLRGMGCFTLGIALIGITATASAQMGMPKDTYTDTQTGKPMSPSASLDGMLSMLEAQVLSAANAMPADKYSFAPSAAIFAADSPAKFTGVRTFAQQLTHLAQANFFFYSSISGAAMPADAKTAGSLTAKDDIVAALKKSFAFAHTQVATITLANAYLGIKGADGMHTPTTVATFGVAHGYDHYGQMVEYLRMNGILPEGSK